MTTEAAPERDAEPAPRWPPRPPAGEESLSSLDVWARSAPIRLAGYEDDPADTAELHILRGID
ncbi:hypothetical protein O7599_34500 [Streptomyces sp. WMMC500]|uniref:hypothetical protein n=1 Tax=Streptomyces sp. WMMC500 TaxID=3015154 RepID=UPI00248CCC9C|nr:hypothetical protein [Streptomyces sp. WMMC500]WBB60558.1 hypothetical protein O7599_34500 [Streptomyces sp. WMMC500]